MHKYQLLRQRAEEFRRVLEEYATVDSDVEHFLTLWMPWYERVQKREIRLPCYEYRLGAYFEIPEISPLAERYSYITPQHQLAIASAGFSLAIEDWLSGPLYLARLKAAGEQPSAILDELPPPDEEAPLVSKPSTQRSGNVVQKLLNRWFGKPS